MKNKLSSFQIILFGFLIFIIIAGVIVFSAQKGDVNKAIATVEVWGTIPESDITELLNEVDKVDRDSLSINYSEIPEDQLEEVFVEAVASGSGPDIVIFTDDYLVKHENKLYPIGYEFYSQQNYKDTFIEAGDILLTSTHIVGLPYIIDPLVLYINRTSLNAAGISTPPKYWDQLFEMVPKLTKVDDSFGVIEAGVALGEYENISHSKEILTTLIRQAGNSVVIRDIDNIFKNIFSQRLGYPVNPSDAAVSFYTQFSNPTLGTYSWNRSLPSSREMFISGDLAYYIGYASEFSDIQRDNPNLNFGVTTLPQSRSGEDNISVGSKLYFLGLVRNSDNLEAAFDTVVKLTSKQDMEILANINNLPPVRRDMLVNRNDNAVLQTFNQSALISRVFPDPNNEQTDIIFSDMIRSYTSGRSSLNQVILRADSQLDDLLKK